VLEKRNWAREYHGSQEEWGQERLGKEKWAGQRHKEKKFHEI
jgi:hypothetical protein